ncbi:alpha-L-fucosidase [Antarcticibacterium sp. 1MA-6-2]|uniref:alpha-L-fucosidase n=1 Tax=Antarcticibacterium sp. 1MA-6-2 TaxID=2908210 RepID=UPI001F15F19F|nr:alpha-L-fucosidase [Antarcticibacterium sp. 1MA-6-2]UJH90410.1 alpha-L-fucosidase [Antarcticibacterium sp. 1MA-6-2]
MNILKPIFLLLFLFSIVSCKSGKKTGPEAVGPVPTPQQLAWQNMEYYAFIHFNMNTFTDMEWGDGGESPENFNPTALDTRQWAKTAKDAGMKGIILTAKHHDGFCLWPTETTGHSVKNSPWKDGKGDVVKELAEACKEYGLKFGVYLSPWDRNHPEYAREGYVEVFHKQLEELMTNYGPLFEVWFDGANGGTGFYGGANEDRKIDDATYYQWDRITEIIREHQPDAVIFSGGNPDIRWIGNEHGYGAKTNWSTFKPGSGASQTGNEDGDKWIPAEADVSIRPGWYYHKREDHQVKSLPHLLDIYYKSIGRNATLLLNLPVDARGIVHENDVKQLMKLREQLDKDFANNLATNAKVKTSSTADSNFSASTLTDGNDNTFWMPEEGIVQCEIILSFERPTEINRFLVQEHIALGQRVEEFKLEGEIEGNWEEIASETTIGYKRILRFDPVEVTALRLKIEDAKARALISNIEVYRAPLVMQAPEISQDLEGTITVNSYDKGLEVYYTLNGKNPDKSSEIYSEKFLIDKPTEVKAVGYNPQSDTYSEVSNFRADIPKKNWKVLNENEGATAIIDADENTIWTKKGNLPQDVVVDLGKTYTLSGFTYLPHQTRYPQGILADYEFLVSENGEIWKKVSEGEFSNIKNNPIEQRIAFDPTQARYFKFYSKRSADASGVMGFAEIGVITD